jgi:5-methyltetrahydropteroyltriglutamate--homocysteine methyltransferase
MEVHASLTGPFPRSEAIVRATRDLDRGRTTPEAVDRLYRTTEDELLQVESRHSLEPRTGGYLRWADLFRPFASNWSGFEVGPVTRWFETNTFYRQPILHAPPERVAGSLLAWFPGANPALPARRAKAILPGPYTFAGMLDNRSGETAEALIHRLGRLLAAEVAELRGQGYETFQFQEPLLVTRPPSGPAAESTIAAYRSLGDAVGGGTSLVWTFFGDAGPALPLLGRLPVSAVGVDLAETEPTALAGFPSGRGIGFGCLDPRTTLLEEPTEAAARVTAACDLARPSGVWLGPGAPLDLLPWDAAVRKVSALAATRELLAPKRGGA